MIKVVTTNNNIVIPKHEKQETRHHKEKTRRHKKRP